MSYTCKCGGLVLEGEEKRQALGYGGKYCQCYRPNEAALKPGFVQWITAPLTADEVRKIVREEIERAGLGKSEVQK